MDIVSSGIPELDKLLGGGLVRAKTYLVERTTGTKARFIFSPFCKQGYLEGDLCKIDSLDDSYSEVIDSLRDGGFDAEKAVAEGKLLILDFVGDVIYGSKVSGPYLLKSSREVDMTQFENLRNLAWEETSKLKASANGLRVTILGLASLIRDFGLQRALRFIVPQVAFLKRQGAIVMATINPDTVNTTDLATIEEGFDGIIELTVKEEKMRFQRYIRVKSSPISSFKQERLPYEIVGGNIGISIGFRIAEDFESYKANLKMTSFGVIDSLGARIYIQDTAVLRSLHRLVFQELGYEKGYALMYQVGADSVETMIRPYVERLKVDISQPTPKLPDIARTLLSSVGLSGYGELKLISLDLQTKTSRARLFNSPVASELTGYGKPVDAYMAGCIGRGVKLVFGGDNVCKEVLCVAKGDDYCEFEVITAQQEQSEDHQRVHH